MRDPEDRPDAGKPARTAESPARGLRREDRLKAALKANMARRKAQARARAGADSTDKRDE